MPDVPSRVSCSTIPYQRYHSFYGRADKLKEISQEFEAQVSSSKIRTVAIWGTGGIGKTQVALEYAHSGWDDGTSVILWISSETDAEVVRSFNEAAQKLQLPGYSEANTPDKNRYQILQWLQSTNNRWLMVFDNVEDERVLNANQPNVGQGDLLITCRSELLAESLARAQVEITTFTIDESTKFFQKILNRTGVSADEIEAMQELSIQLGGLPLAIDIVAKIIKNARRFRSIKEFLPYYEQNRQNLHNPPKRGIRNITYSKDIETVWHAAFQSLDPDANEYANPDATRLIQLLCFVAPEAIPQWLFQTQLTEYPKEWEFLRDDKRFEDAKAELLDLSLIRINVDTGLMSIHRLIQMAYFDQISQSGRTSAFKMTFALLRQVFPTRDGETHFYKRWAICEQFHQHIQALHKVYSSARRTYLPSLNSDYQDLIRDDAWYMLETQQFAAAENMLSSLILEYDTKSIEYAHITRDLMGLFERTGRSNRAVECAQIEFTILKDRGNTQDNDLANAYSDMGYSLCSAFRASEALPYLATAISITKAHGEPECYTRFNIDRFLRNHGRANQQLKQYGKALADFDEAEKYQAKIHGPHSHYDGETKHEQAKIAAWEGRLDEAASLNLEALRLVSEGKPEHPSVSATLYRQGWVLLQQQELDNALLQFERALAICRLNEPQRGNAGESARILWRVAQIYEQKGQIEDAKTFMDQAEKTKCSLLETQDYASPRGHECDSYTSGTRPRASLGR